jgi:N-acetylmuramic acid 6-phosphate etherase
MAGGDLAFIRAIEGAEDKIQAGEDDLKSINLSQNDIVVGIAASGRTPYVLGAIAYAKSIGTKTVGISCNEPATLLDEADIAIAIPTGAEVLAGSTRLKAGTAQKMVLNMLSTTTMVKLGKVYGNLMVDVQITNEKLQLRAERILMELTGLDDVSASKLLEAAEGSVKIAVVMHHENISVTQANQKLNEADGNLRLIIG